MEYRISAWVSTALCKALYKWKMSLKQSCYFDQIQQFTGQGTGTYSHTTYRGCKIWSSPTHVPVSNLDQFFLPVTTSKASAFYDSPLKPSPVSPWCSFAKPRNSSEQMPKLHLHQRARDRAQADRQPRAGRGERGAAIRGQQEKRTAASVCTH